MGCAARIRVKVTLHTDVLSARAGKIKWALQSGHWPSLSAFNVGSISATDSNRIFVRVTLTAGALSVD